MHKEVKTVIYKFTRQAFQPRHIDVPVEALLPADSSELLLLWDSLLQQFSPLYTWPSPASCRNYQQPSLSNKQYRKRFLLNLRHTCLVIVRVGETELLKGCYAIALSDAYIHTYIHTYTHTYIHTYIHIYTYIYNQPTNHQCGMFYVCTYIHTNIHTYIYTYKPTCT